MLTAYGDAMVSLRSRVERDLREQMERLNDKNAEVRRDASERLGWLRAAASDAIAELARLVQTDDSREVRIQASQTLGQIGDAAIPTLLALVNSEDETVQQHAVFGIAAAGQAANCSEVRDVLRARIDAAPGTDVSNYAGKVLKKLENKAEGSLDAAAGGDR